MKKQLISLLFCLLFLCLVPLSVFASSSYVTDDAGLLTSDEIAELEAQCIQFRNDYNMELAFLTVNELNGASPMAYADDYFDANYGADGILLLIDMGQRQWHISTAGTAIEAYSDDDLFGIEKDLVPYLSDGEYYDGFCYFVTDAEYYATNEPISDLTAVLFMTVPAGLVIALIAILIMRGIMNTKQPQRSAENYEVSNSYKLKQHRDLFLYSNVSKTPRQQSSNSSGGSSVHRSSSGRSHGGRGGKF